MTFEFDPAKSRSNKAKHGIDFEKAQAIWFDPDRLEIPAKTSDESRSMIIGRIDQKIWSAVITYREGNTRIISVRRSSESEVTIYES